MTLGLTDDKAALLLKELNGLIDGDRYFLSDRTKTPKAIRAKIRPEPAREPLPPPPKIYAPPRSGDPAGEIVGRPAMTVGTTRLQAIFGS
jgi:hypothetical protein